MDESTKLLTHNNNQLCDRSNNTPVAIYGGDLWRCVIFVLPLRILTRLKDFPSLWKTFVCKEMHDMLKKVKEGFFVLFLSNKFCTSVNI